MHIYHRYIVMAGGREDRCRESDYPNPKQVGTDRVHYRPTTVFSLKPTAKEDNLLKETGNRQWQKQDTGMDHIVGTNDRPAF